MAGETTRWSVTYTKHLKQKRKIYQDGFLDLHSSTNKLMLYDECEKLLECRILSKDATVASGESLAFSAYLVDVGDLHGDHKPLSDSNSQKSTNNPIAFEHRRTKIERSKARSINLSPSQKIIREFKKGVLQKYGPPQSNPDSVKPSTTEWQVLYTTQLTQKAKKYHDGFLRLSITGSLGRQVLLFDESRKLLDSRFLKKDEVVKPGELIAFDAHLVEVGECDGNLGEGNKIGNAEKIEMRHGQRNTIESDTTVKREWQVMYTTQVTQKAKKYHDGFLQLANSGSLCRQIMLYDASKKLLSSRFLKIDEVIKDGESIGFDTYLVDIGEPEGNHQHTTDSSIHISNCNTNGRTGLMHRQQNCLKANKSIVKDGCCDNSNTDEMELRKSVFPDKPLRDAHQILSILQKPLVQPSVLAEGTDKNNMKLVSSNREVQDLETTSVVLQESQLPRASLRHHASDEKGDTQKLLELISSEEIPSCNSCQFNNTDKENSDQFHSKIWDANTKCCDEEFAFGTSSSSLQASHGSGQDEGKDSEEQKNATELEGCPSFDLGF